MDCVDPRASAAMKLLGQNGLMNEAVRLAVQQMLVNLLGREHGDSMLDPADEKLFLSSVEYVMIFIGLSFHLGATEPNQVRSGLLSHLLSSSAFWSPSSVHHASMIGSLVCSVGTKIMTGHMRCPFVWPRYYSLHVEQRCRSRATARPSFLSRKDFDLVIGLSLTFSAIQTAQILPPTHPATTAWNSEHAAGPSTKCHDPHGHLRHSLNRHMQGHSSPCHLLLL